MNLFKLKYITFRNHSFDFKVEGVRKLLNMPKYRVESDIYRAFGVDWSLCVKGSQDRNKNNQWNVKVFLNMNQLANETMNFSLSIICNLRHL